MPEAESSWVLNTPSPRILGHAGRVGKEADQLQNGFVDAGAVIFQFLLSVNPRAVLWATLTIKS